MKLNEIAIDDIETREARMNHAFTKAMWSGLQAFCDKLNSVPLGMAYNDRFLEYCHNQILELVDTEEWSTKNGFSAEDTHPTLTSELYRLILALESAFKDGKQGFMHHVASLPDNIEEAKLVQGNYGNGSEQFPGVTLDASVKNSVFQARVGIEFNYAVDFDGRTIALSFLVVMLLEDTLPIRELLLHPLALGNNIHESVEIVTTYVDGALIKK